MRIPYLVRARLQVIQRLLRHPRVAKGEVLVQQQLAVRIPLVCALVPVSLCGKKTGTRQTRTKEKKDTATVGAHTALNFKHDHDTHGVIRTKRLHLIHTILVFAYALCRMSHIQYRLSVGCGCGSLRWYHIPEYKI